MRLTKHAHACVEVAGDTGAVLIDPGTFTPDAAELIAEATAVLITHEHFDHVDVPALTAALARRPELAVWGPATVIAQWSNDHPQQVHAVRHGEHVTAGGLDIAVHGELHADIHADIPRVTNVGYLIEGSVYHPGDSYHVPDAAVSTLLVPTSGPWTSVAKAADWIRDVGPAAAVQIHEIMLSEIGQRSMAMFLGPDMLGTVPLTALPVGGSLDLSG